MNKVLKKKYYTMFIHELFFYTCLCILHKSYEIFIRYEMAEEGPVLCDVNTSSGISLFVFLSVDGCIVALDSGCNGDDT